MNTVDIPRLREIVGGKNIKTDPLDLYVYGSDASVYHAAPWVIVRPDNTGQVQKVLAYANDAKIPVVPRGGGSGMCGQTVSSKGGILLDMKNMNRILEINLPDVYCRVEPGVVDDDLNAALKPYGVFYPPTPASSRIATIGGEIGNNASGVRSVKYGATRDAVLGMKVVLANGDLVTLGSHTRVEASGYQLEKLIVGSEGTLGVVVEATMSFVPIPEFRCLGVANFDSLRDAGNAIADIMASGTIPSMLELVDDVAIKAVNKTMNLGLKEVAASLLFESDGKVKEAVDYEVKKMEEICKKNNGADLWYSFDAKEREQIFMGRKKLFPALSQFDASMASTSLADDMAVPYSKMADMAAKIHEAAEKNGIIMTAYGHCGSGCMHTKIMMDTSKKEQWEGAQRAIAEIYEYVNSVQGTTSAEHGIGISKAKAFKTEKHDSLKMMAAIKAALDPNNILNPGKLQQAPDNWVTATNLRYAVNS
ncbi:MAG: FAD-linked oxidase C-terminal domain-containing protein [Desulfobacter postgatei]|jgi:glycolate oxidase|uniref:D-lactate dehydrogenase (cytochrome) n=1 Tax=Desulfobacter postgatei 2ac9 TaxID=879212 RepID=I5B211_9BACT|nr:FAD-linked oxidase C-terminal domain-containing protein [Desulfobacter postgatei]EIM63524.1 FAD/FMN-dependent dehydrogenase [Desulfobacter postgatei 2ac9]MDD4274956.1 FAD-linked oxidase C-terminal domain-containing protein [Desulfobacter postgatei]